MTKKDALRSARFDRHYPLWHSERRQLVRWSIGLTAIALLLVVRVLAPFCEASAAGRDAAQRLARAHAAQDALGARLAWLRDAQQQLGRAVQALEGEPWARQERALIGAMQSIGEAGMQLWQARRTDVLDAVLLRWFASEWKLGRNLPRADDMTAFLLELPDPDKSGVLRRWVGTPEADGVGERLSRTLSDAGGIPGDPSAQGDPAAAVQLDRLPGGELARAVEVLGVPWKALFLDSAGDRDAYRELIDDCTMRAAQHRANDMLDGITRSIEVEVVGPIEKIPSFDAALAPAARDRGGAPDEGAVRDAGDARGAEEAVASLTRELRETAGQLQEAAARWRDERRLTEASHNLGFARTRSEKREAREEIVERQRAIVAPIAARVPREIAALGRRIDDLETRRKALDTSIAAAKGEIGRATEDMNAVLPGWLRDLFSPRDLLPLFAPLLLAALLIVVLKARSVRAHFRALREDLPVTGLDRRDPAVTSVFNPAHSAASTSLICCVVYGAMLGAVAWAFFVGLELAAELVVDDADAVASARVLDADTHDVLWWSGVAAFGGTGLLLLLALTRDASRRPQTA